MALVYEMIVNKIQNFFFLVPHGSIQNVRSVLYNLFCRSTNNATHVHS